MYNGTGEMHGEHFIVIMEVEENEKLAKNLSETFWIENVLMWREWNRVGYGFRQSNLYKKIKVYGDMKGKRTFELLNKTKRKRKNGILRMCKKSTIFEGLKRKRNTGICRLADVLCVL